MSHPVSTWPLLADPETPGATLDRTGSNVELGVDLLLDTDGDLVVDTDAHFTTGLQAVQQGCQIRLQTFRGEWFLDRDFGIPYLENDIVPAADAILGGKFNPVKTRSAFRDMLLVTPGVLDITMLTAEFEGSTRTLTVGWRVTTDLGELAGVTEV